MKKFMTMFLIMLLIGIPSAGFAAQVDGPTVAGLVSAYERSYSYDQEILIAANEESDDGFDMAMMMSGIEIRGVTFETDDHAVQYVDELFDVLRALIDEDPDALGHLQFDELEGVDAVGIRVTSDNEDADVKVSTIMIVQDNHLFEVTVRDTELEAAEAKADEILQFILDAEIQSEEISFNQGGTSTGGVFDHMPTAEDDVVGDFTNVTDSEINPEDFV